ncbi:MAG: hypothetical protein P8X86_09515 [Desulfofustis sp.]|jgi:flagellar basal body-associated protein FliL
MTSTRTRKPASKKRRAPRKKKSTSRFSIGVSISRIILFLVLILFFLISIGTAGYVIFFRVVVAAEFARGQDVPSIVYDQGRMSEVEAGPPVQRHTGVTA